MLGEGNGRAFSRLGDGVGALAGAGELSPAAKERRDERVRQVAMTEARARIAAIDAGHRAAVEILSRLGFFPDESPSLGAKPASRTAAVTGDIDYGDDDDLEESARENHVEPKDDRPRVHASLGSESLAQRRADRRSQRRAGRRHAHLMGAQAARDAVERFYGADSEEARTVAAPYSTEAADAAADAELGLSQDGLVDLARETGDEVGYAEGLRTANDALGTSYTVAEMRREGSRRASGPAPGPAPGPARGPAPGPAPGPARGPTPESTPELTLMLGEGNGRAFSRLGDGVGALAGAGELSPAAKERRDERVRQVAMTEARARIAAIDAGHRAAVEILSRLGFFPDESPSLGAKPASRTAAVTGDIDYGDDDDLEESAREDHVEPKDDRPRVHASLGSESLAQRRADRRSQRRAGRRHAHLMGAQAARDAVDRFYGADSEEARTVAAPYSTEAAAAADAELGLSQDGLVDLARETGDEVGYAEGLRTANDALGTSYTVAEMRREGSRRASGPAPGPAPGPARGPAPGPAPGPARGPTPESTPELTLMLGEGNGRAFSRLGDGVGALAGAGELSPAAKERRDERVRQVAMTEARARIAAIDAGHRAAVEILSRLGFFSRRVALPRRETRVQDGGGDGGHRLRRRRRPRRVCSREPRRAEGRPPSRPRVPWF